EPLRIAEYGSGDLDFVVECQLVDDIDRSAIEAGQLFRKLGTSRDFNLVSQPPDDRAKGPYLVIAVTAGDHQIGSMPQRPHTAFRRSARDRLVELTKVGFQFTHLGGPWTSASGHKELASRMLPADPRFFGKQAE